MSRNIRPVSANRLPCLELGQPNSIWILVEAGPRVGDGGSFLMLCTKLHGACTKQDHEPSFLMKSPFSSNILWRLRTKQVLELRYFPVQLFTCPKLWSKELNMCYLHDVQNKQLRSRTLSCNIVTLYPNLKRIELSLALQFAKHLVLFTNVLLGFQFAKHQVCQPVLLGCPSLKNRVHQVHLFIYTYPPPVL